MFRIFSFELGDIFNLNNIAKINGVMRSFLDNINISKLTEEYTDFFQNIDCEEIEEENGESFIELNQYEDMYLLKIDLKGIDLRELSIRYDPGIIEINLNRSEIKKGIFDGMLRNMIVKKAYNKKFEDIEEIDTNQILKSIDNGILSMRMQKKYSLDNASSIVDVDSYQDNVDN